MTEHPGGKPAEEPRPTGLGKGLAEIPDSFFDPLPEDLLRLFEGKDPEGSLQMSTPREPADDGS